MPALRDPKREKFCQEIVKGKDINAAYAVTGLKANRKSAWSYRHHPDSSRRIDELNVQLASRERARLERSAERYAVTTDRVVAELARIAFANTMDYWSVDSKGQPQLDMSKITRDQGAAISEIVVDEYKDSRGADAREVKRVRIKLADKRQALVDLGRHLGLFVDPSVLNLNVSNYFTEQPPSMAEWRKEIELQALPARDDGKVAGNTESPSNQRKKINDLR
jgi:phage terminase small subunit